MRRASSAERERLRDRAVDAVEIVVADAVGRHDIHRVAERAEEEVAVAEEGEQAGAEVGQIRAVRVAELERLLASRAK